MVDPNLKYIVALLIAILIGGVLSLYTYKLAMHIKTAYNNDDDPSFEGALGIVLGFLCWIYYLYNVSQYFFVK